MALNTTQVARLIQAALAFRVAEGTDCHDEWEQELDDTIEQYRESDWSDPDHVVQWAWDYPEAASDFMTRIAGIKRAL